MGRVSILVFPFSFFPDTASNGMVVLGRTLWNKFITRRVYHVTFIYFWSGTRRNPWQPQLLCPDTGNQHPSGRQFRWSWRRFLLLCVVRVAKGSLIGLLSNMLGRQFGAHIGPALHPYQTRQLPDVQQDSDLLGIHSRRSRLLSQPESGSTLGQPAKANAPTEPHEDSQV